MLKTLEDVGYEGAGEVAGEALDGGRALVEEGGKIRGGLVLLAKDVVGVLIQDASVTSFQGDRSDQGDQKAGRLLSLGIVGLRGDGLTENDAVEDCVRVRVFIGSDAHPGTGSEFANDGCGDLSFCAI